MYPDTDLMEKRRKYLRDCEPAELRRLQKKSLLDEHLAFRANLCRNRANDLMAQGVHEGQAWSWAIRSQLLNSPED